MVIAIVPAVIVIAPFGPGPGIGISQNPNARVFILYSLGLSVSLYRLWMPTPK